MLPAYLLPCMPSDMLIAPSVPSCPAHIPALPAGLRCMQDAVREEAYRSMDPLRRLPELLQQAMPITPEVLGPERGLVSEF